MAERFECPDCETVVIGASRCPACGWEPKPAQVSSYRPATTAHGPPPCTREQNLAAARIFAEVCAATARHDRAAVEQGQRRMAELFGEEG